MILSIHTKSHGGISIGIFTFDLGQKVKVKHMLLSTANISKMVIESANIAIKYVACGLSISKFKVDLDLF